MGGWRNFGRKRLSLQERGKEPHGNGEGTWEEGCPRESRGSSERKDELDDNPETLGQADLKVVHPLLGFSLQEAQRRWF